MDKKLILLTDRFDEERPIVGRGGTQDPPANIQLRLPRRGLPEIVPKAGTIHSSHRAEHLE